MIDGRHLSPWWSIITYIRKTKQLDTSLEYAEYLRNQQYEMSGAQITAYKELY